ncbi:MAG TPA: hypothetical protein VGB75_01350 [Jatrophihabitans sp.]|uniref:hypothetical protein n=1 Tax=Jatrophihabitans sp. TaxID=1932789 RepID=UPI002F133328
MILFYRLVQRNQLRTVTVGRSRRVPPTALTEFVATLEQRGVPKAEESPVSRRGTNGARRLCDVDFASERLHIRRQLQRYQGSMHLRAAKTEDEIASLPDRLCACGQTAGCPRPLPF